VRADFSELASVVDTPFHLLLGGSQEPGLSRIYAGQHFRTDHVAGKRLGKNVAESIMDTILLPR
jgi:hypothetical protein